ncbi:putative selenoprotein SelK/SelG [Helianthus anomalus]
MAYVERGVVKPKRSVWRLKTITDFFWAIINFINVFFMTMFSMEKSDGYKKSSRGSSTKWGGGGPGGGPYGGGGPRGPPRGLDNVRGIDHSKLSSGLWILLWRLTPGRFFIFSGPTLHFQDVELEHSVVYLFSLSDICNYVYLLYMMVLCFVYPLLF